MELKLNVYNRKEVVKTYTCDTLDCSFGVVEDIIDILNADSANFDISDTKQLAATVVKCSKQLKPFLKDLFDISDDELRNTHVSEIIEVLKGVFSYATTELGIVAAKN